MRKRSTTLVDEASLREDEDGLAADRQFVVALQRGLDILRCFRPTDSALGNQEIAERTGLPKATVSRLTYTLSRLGYLVYLEASGNYRMGVSVLGLGYACLAGLKIRDTAQPLMQELADHIGDGAMVALGGRDHLSMIYIACARSAGIISLQLNVGSRISLGRSGMGWAYLAAIDEAERAGLLPQLAERAGDAWPRRAGEIAHAAEEIAGQGFCTNFGSWHPQVNSVAVPLRLPQPEAMTLALNCGGPSYILPQEKLMADIGPRLVELARRIASATTYLA